MIKQSIYIIFWIFIITFCSCATLFNSKKTSLKIITSNPSNLIIDKDTLKGYTTKKSITIDRNQKPLTITAYNDSLTKTVKVNSKSSFAYWSNFGFGYGIGMLIDRKSPKKYTYPKRVYIDNTNSDSSYLIYNPLHKHLNILKLTPLKILDPINSAIELSYERKTSNRFSTQITASYLLPMALINSQNDIKSENKGFKMAIEEKYYLKKSAPRGLYLSFEMNYLNNKYKGIGDFDEQNIYTDTFGIKKQTYSFNLKLGHQIIYRRLSIDVYAGLGLKYKDVKHFDRINLTDVMLEPRHPNLFYYTNLEGKYWAVSIPLNMRIGWTF